MVRVERSFRIGTVWRDPHRNTLLFRLVDYLLLWRDPTYAAVAHGRELGPGPVLAPLQSFATMEETLEQTGAVDVCRSGGAT